jgi:hypothetical protein
MQVESIKKTLAVAEKNIANVTVLELCVRKKKYEYDVVGVYVKHSEDMLRIAFNAKGAYIIDALTIPLKEIQSIRIVDKKDIKG